MDVNHAKQKWLITLGPAIALVITLGLWPQPAHADWRSLSGLLPEHVGRVEYAISPDSRTVAFVADIDTDDVNELYAVLITETTPIKLNPSLVTNGDVRSSGYSFTPDGQSVIYLADQEVDNRIEMFRVPASGGEAMKLNPPLVAGGNVSSFRIDAKNGRIVYIADQQTNEVFELWSIPITGGESVKLNGALVSGGDISSFIIDPLSNRVVYSADQETEFKNEIYSVPIAGGFALKLNPPIMLQGGGDSGICCGDFAVNPVVPVVVFIARQADAPRGRLYMIPTAGGELTQLSFEMLATQRILGFRISPAGDRVVFNVATRLGNENSSKGNLYSNLIGGGGAANVTETADPLFGTDNYRILPNGSHVVYSFQNNAGTPERLESATMLGVRAPLYVPGLSDEPLSNFDFSPDSQWVMYQDLFGGLPDSVHTIPPTGGNATNFGSGTYKLITPDSGRIAYTRIVTTENHTELFSAQIFGGDERNLSGMGGTGFVIDVKASPDSKWIVFRVQIDDQYDLRVSDGTEAQPPVIAPIPITGLAATNNGPKEVSQPISFTASISGGTEISYTWDFGDGNVGNGITTTHTYTSSGIYTATVTATNATNSMTATTTVYIGDAVVEVSNNKYTLRDVTIEPGGTVVWVLNEGIHSVTADDGSFNQPASDNWSPFAHSFASAAATNYMPQISPLQGMDLQSIDATTIFYHCTVHGAAMTGTVTVTGEEEQNQNKLLLPNLGKE